MAVLNARKCYTIGVNVHRNCKCIAFLSIFKMLSCFLNQVRNITFNLSTIRQVKNIDIHFMLFQLFMYT